MIRKADLIKKGYEALQHAENHTRVMENREAEVWTNMANAYARLADALGDKAFTEPRQTAVHNW